MTQNDNNQIKELEETLNRLEYELQSHYSDMGKCLLDLAEQEQKKVDKLVDEIIILRKRLSIYKQEIECSTCMTVNPPDAVYCKRCGKKFDYAERKRQNG